MLPVKQQQWRIPLSLHHLILRQTLPFASYWRKIRRRRSRPPISVTTSGAPPPRRSSRSRSPTSLPSPRPATASPRPPPRCTSLRPTPSSPPEAPASSMTRGTAGARCRSSRMMVRSVQFIQTKLSKRYHGGRSNTDWLARQQTLKPKISYKWDWHCKRHETKKIWVRFSLIKLSIFFYYLFFLSHFSVIYVFYTPKKKYRINEISWH